MIELIEQALAALYDALLRGACFALSLTVVWAVIIVMLRKTPAVLRAAGLW